MYLSSHLGSFKYSKDESYDEAKPWGEEPAS